MALGVCLTGCCEEETVDWCGCTDLPASLTLTVTHDGGAIVNTTDKMLKCLANIGTFTINYASSTQYNLPCVDVSGCAYSLPFDYVIVYMLCSGPVSGNNIFLGATPYQSVCPGFFSTNNRPITPPITSSEYSCDPFYASKAIAKSGYGVNPPTADFTFTVTE